MGRPGSTRNVGGIEESLLAILGSFEAKDNQDAYEDAFLGVFQSLLVDLEIGEQESLFPKPFVLLTFTMFEAIFSILRIGKSLELTVESFQLLNGLDKRFPRVYSSDADKSKSSSSVPELIVVEEAWFPFAFSSEISSNEKGAANNSGGPGDSYSFQLLIQELVDATGEANFQASETKVFDEPKWKLKIVVQYLWKFIGKPSIRTRRSNGPPDDDASFNGALKCFSNITSAIKKIRTEVVQLPLAHGFQAHMSLPCENRLVGDASASDEETSSGPLVEICDNIKSAFKNMKAADSFSRVLLPKHGLGAWRSRHLERKALFTAATIVSAESHNMLQVSCK